MLNHKLNITLLTCFCLLFASHVHADENRRGPDGKAMIQKLKKLGVERAVIKKIKRISIANRKAQVPLKSKVELAKIELHELLEADEVNEATVMKAIDKVAAAHTMVRKNQVRTMLKIRSLLTPEQRVAFKEFVGQRRGKRKMRHKQRR